MSGLTKAQRADREDARLQLLSDDGYAALKPGETIYCILRHVSSSGMYRAIDLFIMRDRGYGDGPEPCRITHLAARACGFKYDRKHEAIGVSGCGQDMGFALVYDLGCVLFPDGFTCAGKRCPSNDHINGDRDYTPHHHKNGGYAFRSQWL